MKKTMLLTMAFITLVLNSFAADPSPLPASKSNAITSLVVNANVTVVLVTNANQEVQLMGDPHFMKEITLKQIDGNLVIDGNRNHNFKGRGFVYVPATYLQQIKINNAAFIRSSSALKIPNLKIMVNGNCKVHISTIGKVDFVENDLYEVDYQVIERDPFATAVVKTRE